MSEMYNKYIPIGIDAFIIYIQFKNIFIFVNICLQVNIIYIYTYLSIGPYKILKKYFEVYKNVYIGQ